MAKYGFWLTVDDKKVDEVFERLMKAKLEIEECYTELRNLDVIRLSSEISHESEDSGEEIIRK